MWPAGPRAFSVRANKDLARGGREPARADFRAPLRAPPIFYTAEFTEKMANWGQARFYVGRMRVCTAWLFCAHNGSVLFHAPCFFLAFAFAAVLMRLFYVRVFFCAFGFACFQASYFFQSRPTRHSKYGNFNPACGYPPVYRLSVNPLQCPEKPNSSLLRARGVSRAKQLLVG